jgi:hypothetical protein
LTIQTFEEYLETLSAVAPRSASGDPEALGLCVHATATINALDSLDRLNLAIAVQADPELLPVLAAAVGLSQERFKTWLQTQFRTAGWITLGRKRGDEVIESMDEEFDLIATLARQSARKWTWADVLAGVMAPRQRAGSAIQQGRNLEDEVESVIQLLGLEFGARTRFEGARGATAPSDFAIPSGGSTALIIVAVKGFDSTGSKLTDASREIEEMAKVRKPNQFIFAVVDGQGWLRRQNDLRRIHALWSGNEIDGLYNRASLGEFDAALQLAARRLGLTE